MSDTKKIAIAVLCAAYGVYTAIDTYKKVTLAIEAREQEKVEEEEASSSEATMQQEYETAPEEVVTATA